MAEIVDSVVLLKEAHRTTWRGQNQDYWFKRLVQEVGELGSSLANDHPHSPDWELYQIASICLNWLEMRKAIGEYEVVEQKLEDAAQASHIQAYAD